MGVGGSIDGIFSGLDTTSIIDSIIKAEHRKVDVYLARQAEYTQKLTSWQTINSYMLAFKTQADVLSKPGIWDAMGVTSSDQTKIMATATGSASSGTYFVSVDQLAQNQQIASQGFSSSSAIVGTGTVEISLAGGAVKTITLEPGKNSLEYLKSAINDARAGISAAIINDGSSNQPYRLILTSNQSGAANVISFSSSLTGGTAPDFSTSYFDVPEKLDWASNATSNPTLGATAAYSGSLNKTFTFTVQGTGTQTLGSGPIDLAWTDGTNSGTITVNASGEEVALTGDGSDGLTLSFSAGDLVGGDTFQVQAMAPVIQSGQDAILRLGASGSGGSPIIVTSASNKVTTLIDGVTLDLLSTTTESIKIEVKQNTDSIVSTVGEFVNKYNELADFINEQMKFQPETNKAGVLLGDASLLTMLSDVRSSVLRKVSGITGDLTMLSDIGIKFDLTGKLKLDTSVLNNNLTDNLENVKNLLLASGSSDNNFISFLSAGTKVVPTTSGYNVDITQVAAQGTLAAAVIPDPEIINLVLTESNNNIKINVNGLASSTIALDPGTYTSGADLAAEIQTKINADSALGSNEVEVSWVDNGDSGYLQINSTLWGSNSKVTISESPTASAHDILGFTTGVSTDGQDVEGTINGESASGVGQILTGDDDNENTAGLKLKITMAGENLVSGSEGRIFISKGVASMMSEKVERYTDSVSGVLTYKTNTIQTQINNLKEQVDRMEQQLERKRASLYDQFIQMEEALGQLQSQQQYLSSAIASLGQYTIPKSGNRNS